MHFAAMLLWTAVGFLPGWLFGRQWELFLSQIPVVITVLVAVIAGALFLMEIKKLMNIRKREVAYYAGC
jgi:membrane protein DedA with SNARE-associated domain